MLGDVVPAVSALAQDTLIELDSSSVRPGFTQDVATISQVRRSAIGKFFVSILQIQMPIDF